MKNVWSNEASPFENSSVVSETAVQGSKELILPRKKKTIKNTQSLTLMCLCDCVCLIHAVHHFLEFCLFYKRCIRKVNLSIIGCVSRNDLWYNPCENFSLCSFWSEKSSLPFIFKPFMECKLNTIITQTHSNQTVVIHRLFRIPPLIISKETQ